MGLCISKDPLEEQKINKLPPKQPHAISPGLNRHSEDGKIPKGEEKISLTKGQYYMQNKESQSESKNERQNVEGKEPKKEKEKIQKSAEKQHYKPKRHQQQSDLKPEVQSSEEESNYPKHKKIAKKDSQNQKQKVNDQPQSSKEEPLFKPSQKKQEINSSNLQKQAKKDEEEDQCPICLDRKVDMATACNHKFCRKCIEAVIKINNSCPICRRWNPLNAKLADERQPIKLQQSEWNVSIARKVLLRHYEGDPEDMRRVFLVNEDGKQQVSNIQVNKNAKIQVAPSANIFINGKKVENVQECNQQ